MAAALTAASSFAGHVPNHKDSSGFFIHAKAGGPEWPPGIENQLKTHWNSKNGGKSSTAAAGDCDQLWAGDYWILNGVQITNKDGQLTQLGGCSHAST